MKSRTQIHLVVASALVLSFALIGTSAAVDWVGKRFPGFLVLGNSVVASVAQPGWPGTEDGLIFQHRVVAVEDRPVDGPEALRARMALSSAGEELRYRFERDGRTLERSIATQVFRWRDAALLFGVYLVNGLLLGVAALLMLMRSERPGGSAAPVPFLLLASLWGLSAMDLYGPHVLFRFHALCEALLFAAGAQMALEFPTPLLGEEWARRVRWLLWAAAGALAIAYQWFLFDPSLYSHAHLAATSLGGAALLAVIVSLMVRYWWSTEGPLRESLRPLALGALLALLLPVAVTLPETLTGGTAPQNVVGCTVFVFPLALVYAAGRESRLPRPMSVVG